MNYSSISTGVYPDIPSADYHNKIDAISNSYLSKLDKCPAAAKIPSEGSAVFTFGSAFHTIVLEEHKFGEEFAVCPTCDKRTKEGKERFSEFQHNAQGKDVITEADYETLLEMRKAVYNHDFAATILADGISESSVVWTDEGSGARCKCRPDRIPSNGGGVLIDLKTTTDCSEYGFGRSIVNYGYARQAAFYLDGYNAATGSDCDAFVFIAIEKTAPYRVATYLLDGDFVQYGRDDYKRLIGIEMQCRASGKYPNWLSNQLETIYKPNYFN